MPDVKVPVLGNVPKKGLVVGVLGAAVVGGYLVLRHKSSAAAAPAATSDGAGGAYGYGSYGYGDGANITPYPFGEQYGYGAYGYGDYNPYTGQYLGGGTGTTPGTGTGGVSPPPVDTAPTTNPQWVAQTVPLLKAAGYTTAASIAALARYTQGHSVTSNQRLIVEAAIALNNYPPVSGKNNKPPGIVSGKPVGQGGGGGNGPKPTHYIHANGHEDLYQIAHHNGISEALLVSYNLNLSRYVGSKKNIPKGTRVKV
jgi:hypothetical protein